MLKRFGVILIASGFLLLSDPISISIVAEVLEDNWPILLIVVGYSFMNIKKEVRK